MIWQFKEDQYQDVDHKKNWSSDDELEESIYTHPGTRIQFIHRSFISISFGLCTHRTSHEDDLQKFFGENPCHNKSGLIDRDEELHNYFFPIHIFISDHTISRS
jgi:hypothetical protein